MEFLNFNSVELLPNAKASAAFMVDSGKVFREDTDITPVVISESLSYIPWGADNQMPFDILNLIESDETLSTCQMFNAEVCYGSGLIYNTDKSTVKTKEQVDDFFLENNIAGYYLGVCQDFKHFAFCVSVIILNAEGNKVVRLARKEACYCRFTPGQQAGENRKGTLCKLAWYGAERGYRGNNTARHRFAVDGLAGEAGKEREDTQIRYRYPCAYPRQHILPHTVLCSSVQREVVQYQIPYRYGKGSEAEELRTHKVPH